MLYEVITARGVAQQNGVGDHAHRGLAVARTRLEQGAKRVRMPVIGAAAAQQRAKRRIARAPHLGIGIRHRRLELRDQALAVEVVLRAAGDEARQLERGHRDARVSYNFV